MFWRDPPRLPTKFTARPRRLKPVPVLFFLKSAGSGRSPLAIADDRLVGAISSGDPGDEGELDMVEFE